MSDFYPAAQQLQSPDILGSYIRGQMAPLQVQQAQQQVTAGALDIDKLRLALQQQQQVMGYASQLAGSQTNGAQNTGGQSGGIQNGPQGAVSSQQPSQSSGSYDGSFGSNTRVNTMMALDILQGRDPLKTAEGAQAYEQKQRQLQAQGPLATLDTIAGSASPARIVMNNPGLMQRWQQMAPQLGLDPVKDFSDDNVRQAIGFARNQIAGAAGLPTTKPVLPAQQIAGPNGQRLSRDPITGEIKEETKEEPLHAVIGDNGQPVLLPSSQAAGKQPFNQSIFGAANISDQQKELAYQTYITTGGKLPSAMLPRSDAGKSQLMSYIADRAAKEGNTAVSIAANGQATQATQGVVTDFTKGKTAQTLNGLNTSIQHIDSLLPLVDKLDNTSSPLFNKAANFFKEQTGQSAPTNYAALKEFVGGEVAKAVLPGGGGEKEREALIAPLNAANSPTQLKEALQTIQTALAGKTEALRQQWDVGTRGTQGSFDKFLLPATKKSLGIGDTSGAGQGKGSPVKVNSPDEAMKLAPGTVFVTPDGRTKVR